LGCAGMKDPVARAGEVMRLLKVCDDEKKPERIAVRIRIKT